MNKQIVITVSVWLLVGLGAIPANSQVGVQAKVPFDFRVMGKAFPSGEYRMIIGPHELKIEDRYAKPLAVFLANDTLGLSAGEIGRIVFRCYGDRCFLAELWAPAHEHGLAFPRGRGEFELAREHTGTYFALLGERISH